MQPETASRNCAIDGWRGLSVMLVIVGHLVDFRLADVLGARPFRDFFAAQDWGVFALLQQIALRLLAALPSLGVDVFFIVSGYLITSLLTAELFQRGNVSFTAFYVRRFFRIVPAFYTYLLVVGVLTSLDWVSVDPRHLLLGAGFLCDLRGDYCSWWLGHTWTLSVEEQFYLVWPALYIALGAHRGIGVGAAFCLLLASSFFLPDALGFAHIAMGALYALSPRVRALIDALGRPGLTIFFSLILLLIPFLASVPAMAAAVSTLAPLMLASIVFSAVKGRGPFAALVRTKWLGRIGVVSYSLYLWQQLFTGPPLQYENAPILGNPLLLLIPALLSYVAVERPAMALGHRLSDAIKKRSQNAGQGVRLLSR